MFTRRKRRALVGLIGMGLSVATVGHAFADVIDGDWCAPDGRHMSVHGPSIVTPGGKQIAGLYSRHTFSYVIPDAEPSAGATVSMRLVNPDTVNLWKGAPVVASSPAEVWTRCTPISALNVPQWV